MSPEAEDEDRKEPYEIEMELNGAWYEHGTEKHTGYRCGICALATGRAVQVFPDLGSYWLEKQVAWQEECDVLMVGFDVQVAKHFPDHLPPTPIIDKLGQTTWAHNCETCPKAPDMPAKPLPPFERRPPTKFEPRSTK